MNTDLLDKKSVLITGIGGGGILTAGLLLSRAATTIYRNVTCFPTYDISKRGGRIECTVSFSNEEIASPIIDRSTNLIVAESSQLMDYQPRVSPGGNLFIESNGTPADINMKNVSIIKVPAINTAIDISGKSNAAIIVFIGALVAFTNILPADLIIQELEKTFSNKRKLLSDNLDAFKKGLLIS